MHFHSLLSLHFFVIAYKLLTICMYVNESKTKNKSTEIKATGKREQLCRFRCLLRGCNRTGKFAQKRTPSGKTRDTYTTHICFFFYFSQFALVCTSLLCGISCAGPLFFSLCLSVMSNLWYN